MSRPLQRFSKTKGQRKKQLCLSVSAAKQRKKIPFLNCIQNLTTKDFSDHQHLSQTSETSCEVKLRNFSYFLHTLMAPPISLKSAAFYHSLMKNIQLYLKYLKESNQKQCKQLNQALKLLLQQTKNKRPEYPHLANLITLGSEVLQEIIQKDVSDISMGQESTDENILEFQPEERQRFLSMGIRKQLRLPKCHPGKQVSVDFMYENANYLGIQSAKWEEFVDDSFEMYRKFKARPLFRHKRTRSWFPEGLQFNYQILNK